MDMKKIESLLTTAMTLLDIDNVKSASAEAVVQEIYNEFAQKYRPLIQAAPALAEDISADLLPSVKAIMKLINKMKADEEVQSIILEAAKVRAQMRKKILTSYTKAGFRREEAMALLLLDVANTKAITSNLKMPTFIPNKK